VKRTVRRYRRKRRGGGGKSLIKTAFKFIRLGALAAPGINEFMHHTTQHKQNALTVYAGVHEGKFDWQTLVGAWTPYLGAVLATYGIPKIAGIIRKL